MICFTGAGGQVGSEVVKQLAAHDIPMRFAFNSVHKAIAARDKGLEAVTIDFHKSETLLAGFRAAKRSFCWGQMLSNNPNFK